MVDKIYSIDFEYNHSHEPKLNLICCCIKNNTDVWSFWLQDNNELPEFISFMKSIEGQTLLAYNVSAEARSLLAANIDPLKYKWIDPYIEYKMLLNHNDEFKYGKQFINGKYLVTKKPKPKWQRTKEDSEKASSHKAEQGLLAALYKILDIDVLDNKDLKDRARDIILSLDDSLILENKEMILKYCHEDVEYLMPLYKGIIDAYIKFFNRSYRKDHMPTIDEIHWRAETNVRQGMMENLGYPINVEQTKNFSNNVPLILKELCEDINSRLDQDMFRWNKSRNAYSLNTKVLFDFIASSPNADRWKRTETGNFARDKEAFERFYNYKHEYPDTIPGQYLRFIRTKTSLNGFLPPSKKKRTLFDDLGSDGRVRANLSCYSAQSARYQPKATSFIPLKSAWMRSLIQPKEGRAIVSIDYASQEFLLAAAYAEDKNMLDAYESGDVYLYLGKLAGHIPKDGTKKQYKAERDAFKSTTLGISYSMGSKGLANKLTLDTGKEYTEEDAAKLIDLFESAYPKYKKFKSDVLNAYRNAGLWKLPDGWIMFNGNDNDKSVTNVPVQGLGSCLLRRAIADLQDDNVDVLYPLHDAIYCECDIDKVQETIDKMLYHMRNSFNKFKQSKLGAPLIRFDIDVWGKGCQKINIDDASVYDVYIDERSQKEYDRFKKYFISNNA